MIALCANVALLTALTVPSPTTAPGELKTGTYKGPATVTSNDIETTGRLTLTIKSVDRAGNVKGTVRGSNGLVGVGEFTGTVDEDGVFRFQGTLTQQGALTTVKAKIKGKARVSGDRIKGTYNLEYNPYGQIYEADAVFEVKFVDE
ncbi:MAG TPA: hypothetical protein VKE74_09285 [Gemmataceae bacterium]|nr:hypothetical protein [Gemmataceae bacterium]